MDPAAADQTSGESGTTALQTLKRALEHQRDADKRTLRFTAGIAAITGAAIGTGALFTGIAPALVILVSIIPGAFTGYACARSARQRRTYFQESLRLFSPAENSRMTAKETPSPRVLAILRELLTSSNVASDANAK